MNLNAMLNGIPCDADVDHAVNGARAEGMPWEIYEKYWVAVVTICDPSMGFPFEEGGKYTFRGPIGIDGNVEIFEDEAEVRAIVPKEGCVQLTLIGQNVT